MIAHLLCLFFVISQFDLILGPFAVVDWIVLRIVFRIVFRIVDRIGPVVRLFDLLRTPFRIVDGVVDGVVDGIVDGVVDEVADGVVDGVVFGVVDGVVLGVVDGIVLGVVDGIVPSISLFVGDSYVGLCSTTVSGGGCLFDHQIVDNSQQIGASDKLVSNPAPLAITQSKLVTGWRF